MDLNKVQLIGRLTRDPEIKTTPSGQNVATFSVATSRSWKDQQSGEKKSVTEFHNIVAWRKLADIVGQYMKKGKQVYIEGYLQTRSWDDPTGSKKYRTEIVADNMIMLGSAGGDGGSASYGGGTTTQPQASTPAYAPTPQAQGPEEETISVEDIPF
jgi:single-strand DNA-binding protein